MVTIEVPPSIASSFTTPGQFIKLKSESQPKPSFFAIASPPNANKNTLTFMIKQAASNDFVLNAPSSVKLQMSAALGSGFKIDEFFNKYKNDFPTINVILLACGTGIAPIASVIESNALGLKTVSYTSLMERTATLYYGVRTPKHLLFEDRFSSWESLGIKIVPVISRLDDEKSKGWTGRTGYIQDSLKMDGVRVPRNSGALLCGQR